MDNKQFHFSLFSDHNIPLSVLQSDVLSLLKKYSILLFLHLFIRKSLCYNKFAYLCKRLAVNVEVLTNSDFDGIKAMHRLFQVFRQYDGHLFECKDQNGNDMVAVSFGTLSLMRSWCDRYEEYMKEVEKCNSIKDVKKRGEALLKAEADFNLWMDIYPESEPFDMNLQIQKTHDEFMDKIGLNPKEEK